MFNQCKSLLEAVTSPYIVICQYAVKIHTLGVGVTLVYIGCYGNRTKNVSIRMKIFSGLVVIGAGFCQISCRQCKWCTRYWPFYTSALLKRKRFCGQNMQKKAITYQQRVLQPYFKLKTCQLHPFYGMETNYSMYCFRISNYSTI